MRKRIYTPADTSTINKYSKSKYIKMAPLRIKKTNNSVKASAGNNLEHDSISLSTEITNETIDRNYFVKMINTINQKAQDEGFNNAIKGMQGYIPNGDLWEHRYRFDTTQDPFSAFSIFSFCIEKGYYPPIEVLKFLSAKFRYYLSNNCSLDKAIGVNNKLRTSYRKRRRDISILIDVEILRHYFNISTVDAIEAVKYNYASEDIYFDIDTFRSAYYRDGKKAIEQSLKLALMSIFSESIYDDGDLEEYLLSILFQYPDTILDKLMVKYIKVSDLLASVEKLEGMKINLCDDIAG